jgi:dTDP-4-amino-4,6-dideoxygalactose transaminase
MRDKIWNSYYSRLEPLQAAGQINLPHVPEGCEHNSHIFYIRVLKESDFQRLAKISKERKIGIFTHYVPLHMSTGGKRYGRTSGDMNEAETCNSQLFRLPIWPGLKENQVEDVVKLVFEAFHMVH